VKYCLSLILISCVMTMLAADPAFVCTSNVTGNIQFTPQPLQLKFKFENKGTFSGDLTELIRVTDFQGNGLTPTQRTVKLAPNTVLTREIELPADRKGFFVVSYSLFRDNELLFSRSVTGAILDPVKQLDPAGSPLGMYCHNVQWNGKRELPILRNMGIVWVRTNLCWRENEPQRGNIQWKTADKVYSTLRDHDMNIMFNLVSPPSWAVKKINSYGGNPADFQDYAVFAARVAARYPDAHYLSLWNEPDAESHWDGGGAEYARMLKTVTPAIRAANPAAKVLPGGVTGSPALATKFMRELNAAGGRPFFDIYDYHYRNVAMHRQLIREFGWKDLPLLNSESAEGQDKAPQLVRETVSGLAAGMERTFLFLFWIKMTTPAEIEEFEPVVMVDNDSRPTTNFSIVYTMSRMLNEIKNCRDVSSDNVNLYAYQNGASPHCYVIWGKQPELRAVTLKSAGDLKAVDVGGQAHQLHPFNGIVSIPAADITYLQGNEIQPAGRAMAEIAKPLTEPIFGTEFSIPVRFFNPSTTTFQGKAQLIASPDWELAEVSMPLTLAPNETREIICRLKPRNLTDCSKSRLTLNLYQADGKLTGYDYRDLRLTTPLNFELSSAFRWGESYVRAAISNPTAAPVKATIRFSVPGNPKLAATMPVTLPPLKTSFVYFNPELSTDKHQGKVETTLTYPGGVIRKTAALNWIAIKSTGNAPIVLKERSDYISPSRILFQWDGPRDLSAVAYLSWDAKYLHLTVDVTDDIHSAEADPELLWQRDSLQIWFNGMLFNLGLTEKGVKLFRHHAGSTTMNIPFSAERKGNITSYHISFPKPDGSAWKENDTATFAFIVNDADVGAERKGWLYYLSDIGDHRSRQATPSITLIK